MNMKKFLAMLLALCMVLSMAACGTTGSSAEAPASGAEAAGSTGEAAPASSGGEVAVFWYTNNAMEVRISDYGNSEPADLPENAEAENQDAPKGNSDGETSCFETSGPPDSGDLDHPKPDANKNDNIKTEFRDIESIHPIYPQMDTMDGTALLREKWGYPALLDSYSAETLDGLILLGADVLSTTAPTLRIGGQALPTKQVQQRLLSLDMTHIDYVLECFQKTRNPIRNIRAYLLTALYNAPNTIDAYYENQVRQQEGV